MPLSENQPPFYTSSKSTTPVLLQAIKPYKWVVQQQVIAQGKQPNIWSMHQKSLKNPQEVTHKPSPFQCSASGTHVVCGRADSN